MLRNRRMLSRVISTSEKVNFISDHAALLYTWNIAHLDDYGRGDASVFFLKSAVVPARDWTKQQVKNFRDEIIKIGLMQYYEINKKEYWFMEKADWDKHQWGSWHSKQMIATYPEPKNEKNKNGVPTQPKGQKGLVSKPLESKNGLVSKPNGGKNGLVSKPKEGVNGYQTDKLSKAKLSKAKKAANESYALPLKDTIENSAKPKLLKDIEELCEELYNRDIFPTVFSFKNKMLKIKKNPRALLHCLSRCFIEKPIEPWAYCTQIMKIENGNFNEREHGSYTAEVTAANS